uniref:Uncharacterized protein n=2 Tax=Eptatretus burgeri TaxID=7764 RepID=A0A8C4QNR4_EPTBU
MFRALTLHRSKRGWTGTKSAQSDWPKLRPRLPSLVQLALNFPVLVGVMNVAPPPGPTSPTSLSNVSPAMQLVGPSNPSASPENRLVRSHPSTSHVMRLVNPSHPSTLLRRANQLRQAGTLCDVVIAIDGFEFRAHRAVLAAASRMFELLFGQRGGSTRYTLDFLSPRTFSQVLEYAYTAALDVCPQDLDDLLYAADILDMAFLEEQCLRLLEALQRAGEPGIRESKNQGLETVESKCDEFDATEPKSQKPGDDGGNVEEFESRDLGFQGQEVRAVRNQGVDDELTSRELRVEASGEAHVGDGELYRNEEGDQGIGLSPRQLAVDSLMSLRNGGFGRMLPAAPVTEDESRKGCWGMGEQGAEGGYAPWDLELEPGTPTRHSVITSTRVGWGTGGNEAIGGSEGVQENEGARGSEERAKNHGGELSCPPDVASIVEIDSEQLIEGEEMELDMEPRVKQEVDEERGCDICFTTFPDEQTLWAHRKLHAANRKLCDIDRKSHGGVRDYICDLCGKHFLDSLRLRMHQLSHSVPDGGQVLSCEQCGCLFGKESSLEKHRESHQEAGRAYFCLLCGKRVGTRSALLVHTDSHAGESGYSCGACSRPFPSHSALKRHLRTHTAGEHPFECEFCGCCYRDENSLRNHRQIHTGEKPFTCNGCGKRFSLKHQLETHYRVHTGTATSFSICCNLSRCSYPLLT